MNSSVVVESKSERYVVLARMPPPLGGVSVFAERKVRQLKHAGYNVTVVDFGSKDWLWSLLRTRFSHGRPVYLVNTLHPVILLLLGLLGVLGRASLYDHNHSRHYVASPLKRRVLRFFARRAMEVIVVNDHLKAFYLDLDVPVKVKSPFIPPDVQSKTALLSEYPREVLEFVDADGNICIMNSASRYSATGDGEDLYGVRMSLELLMRLRENGVPARLIFAFAEYEPEMMPSETARLIDRLQAEGCLYVMSGQLPIWPLFERVAGFLRTTATDGQSVSVLEALHFGCPVVASDVVPRPAGVVTYEYGDVDSLYRAVMTTIVNA